LLDGSRVCQPFKVKLLTTFYRRRYGKLQASIGIPLPKLREPATPQNFVLEAIRVKEFMTANPEETYLSAAPKLNLHRKRIAKFIQIADNLPKDIITKLANCNDPKILRQMSVQRLYSLAQPQQISQ
jgi:plasmid maintenance system antidote protein VapI